MLINKSILTSVVLSMFLVTACVKEDLSEAGGNVHENFDLLWKTINDNYCYLEYKNINWDSIGNEYRSQLHADMKDREFFTVCSNMLNELKDGHVWIYSDFNTSSYGDWYLDYPQNFNPTIVDRYYLGSEAVWVTGLRSKKIRDVGYLRCPSFMSLFSFSEIDEAVSQLGDIEGLIIDIRDNTGGSLVHAQMLASAFCKTKTKYGYIRFKEDQGDNYSDWFPQYLEPKSKTVYDGKIVVLTNRMCYSAANDFANAMRSLNNVTIIGDKTGGGGGMPISSELYNGWQLGYSINPLFDKEKNHTESGIEPDIYLDMDKDDEYNNIDNIIEYSIDYLKTD